MPKLLRILWYSYQLEFCHLFELLPNYFHLKKNKKTHYINLKADANAFFTWYATQQIRRACNHSRWVQIQWNYLQLQPSVHQIGIHPRLYLLIERQTQLRCVHLHRLLYQSKIKSDLKSECLPFDLTVKLTCFIVW